MPTSDEELAALADEVQSLREEVAQSEVDRVARETSSANDVAALQLEAEKARLTAQLVTAKAREEAVASGNYTDSPLDAAKAELRAAVAQQEAAEAAARGEVPDQPAAPPPPPVTSTPPVTPSFGFGGGDNPDPKNDGQDDPNGGSL